jgi:hypothetical protein
MIRMKTLMREWTGERWTSCAHWRSHRVDFLSGKAGARVRVIKTNTMFMLQYKGPASGVAMSHAARSKGDTLHQLWNVLICELNPQLMANQLKPQIDSITTSCEKVESDYVYTIQVPLVADSEAWQINHRGGWGHDPGPGAVTAVAPKSPKLEGPVRYTDAVPNSNAINTYVVTYPLVDAK